MRITPDPYAVLDLKPGIYEIEPVEFQNRNKASEPKLLLGKNALDWTPDESGFYRFLSVKSNGWHDTLLLWDGKWNRVRKDGRRLDAPWYDVESGLFNDAWVYYLGNPEGAYGIEAWLKPGLTINGDGVKVYMESKNSPSEMLAFNGNGSEVHTYGFSGEQSRIILDRAPVVIAGNKNRVYGSVEGQIGCVFVNGDENYLVDMAGLGCSHGDDTAVFSIRGKRNGSTLPHFGNRLSNCKAVQRTRSYPAEHMVGGIRLDDKHDKGRITNCRAHGFMYGFHGNGATNTTVDWFTSAYCQTPGLLAPHHETPGVEPIGNKVTNMKVLE